jgi:tetratricopeptide (TPR) repeat protein
MVAYFLLDCATNTQIGSVLQSQKQHDEAVQQYRNAEVLCRELGDRKGEISAMRRIASSYWSQNKLDQAVNQFQSIRTICHDRREFEREEADVLRDMAKLKVRMCEFEAARTMLNASLALRDSMSDQINKAFALSKLGDISLHLHELDTADRKLREAEALFVELGHLQGQGNCKFSFGWAKQLSRDWEAALDRYREALKLFARTGDKKAACFVHVSMANCYREMAERPNEDRYTRLMQARDLVLNTFKDIQNQTAGAFDCVRCNANVEFAFIELALYANKPTFSNLTVAQKHSEEALKIALAQDFKEGVARAKMALGEIFSRSSRDLELALQFFEGAREMFSRLRDLDNANLVMNKYTIVQQRLAEQQHQRRLSDLQQQQQQQHSGFTTTTTSSSSSSIMAPPPSLSSSSGHGHSQQPPIFATPTIPASLNHQAHTHANVPQSSAFIAVNAGVVTASINGNNGSIPSVSSAVVPIVAISHSNNNVDGFLNSEEAS